jgi:hypothetical protein
MALTKRDQIEVVADQHNEVENVAIHLDELRGAFEILGMKTPAKKLRVEIDRLYDVARKLTAVWESMIEEELK